jgi:2-polyprenyl-6-hydroxyphenyl methylase/3-demethylubiquinone-9 3-methyltransferase
MKQLKCDATWPEMWQEAHVADLFEFWGSRLNLSYTYYYQRRFRAIINVVRSSLPRGASVIDLAAAQGNFSLALAEAGYRVTWNDLRANFEGYVRLKYEQGDISYLPGNIFDVATPAESFDAVLACEVIEHVAHPDELFATIRAMLHGGGLLFLSTPNGEYVRAETPTYGTLQDLSSLETQQFSLGADGHLFLLTNAELVGLAADADFEVVSLQNICSPVIGGRMHLMRGALRVLPRVVITGIDRAFECLPRSARRKLMLHTVAVFRLT